MFSLVSLKTFIRQSAHKFRREGGAVLIYVTLTLPVLVGLGVLAVDGARLFNLSTELQKAADALALAAAAELDGRGDSITRANSAIAVMVSNEQRFGSGTRLIFGGGQVTWRYLSSLPADDAAQITSSYESGSPPNPAATRFIEVTVQPRTLTAILPANFLGASMTASTRAVAVAGFSAAVCKSTPMFICNPFELTGIDIFSTAALGRQITMQMGGGSGPWTPGNYGWLDVPDDGLGGNPLPRAVASASPAVCYDQRGVAPHPGSMANLDDALNVRFDIWSGSFNNADDKPQYRPARNTRKGYEGGNCNPNTATIDPQYRFGRDGSFSGRLGDGIWDFAGYKSRVYGTTPPSAIASLPTNSTRYQVYRREIDANLLGQTPPSGFNETGNYSCYTGAVAPNDVPDRRLLYAAIINCSAEGVTGGSSGGPYHPIGFGKFFMTEPVPFGSQPDAATIFAEFVDVVRPGPDNDIARDQVQLYR